MKKMTRITMGIAMGLIILATGTVHGKRVYAAESSKGIVVTGKGSIKVKPDTATVNLGVSTEDAIIKTAQEENTKKMNALIEAIKALGIDEKDIQTSGYSVYPKYNYNENNRITGYTVNNSIRVIIRDIAKVGEILDKSVEAGANMSGGIQFSLSDDSEHYEKAMIAAIGNAKDKGMAVAKTIGVTIGTPSSVVESGNYSNPVMYMDVQYDTAKEGASMRSAGTSIQGGEIEVTAVVTVTYGYTS